MAKTQDLSGMEGEGVAPVKNKALDNRIERWREAVEQRMLLTEKEVNAKAAVINFMHENGISKYRFEDDEDNIRIVELSSTERLKFKKEASDQDGDTSETDINDD